MAHPKKRTSKQRKRKRRTHKKATAPTLTECQTTGEIHRRHHAYWVDGALYYRGQVVIPAPEFDEF
jgi:large subunit ribosomal protein L32